MESQVSLNVEGGGRRGRIGWWQDKGWPSTSGFEDGRGATSQGKRLLASKSWKSQGYRSSPGASRKKGHRKLDFSPSRPYPASDLHNYNGKKFVSFVTKFSVTCCNSSRKLRAQARRGSVPGVGGNHSGRRAAEDKTRSQDGQVLRGLQF